MIQLATVERLIPIQKILQKKLSCEFTFSNTSVKSQRGFTLIELLVVIAIIGVLEGIVVVAIDPVALIGRSNDSKDRSDAQQIKNALQLYFNDFNNYPAEADFVALGCADCLTPDYMRVLPAVFAAGDAEYTGPGETAGVPATEYRAGFDLDQPSAVGNDDGSFIKCGSEPSAWAAPGGNYDYFICPD